MAKIISVSSLALIATLALALPAARAEIEASEAGPGSAKIELKEGETPYTKGGNCDDSRIKSNKVFLKALKAIKMKTGQTPKLTSCFRDQGRQNAIRASVGCGKVDCRGRVAKRSQHTYGIAADISIPGYSQQKLCELLSEIRQTMFTQGGVGAYPGGAGHLDMRLKSCSWNVCTYLRQRYGHTCNKYVSPTVEKYIVNSTQA